MYEIVMGLKTDDVEFAGEFNSLITLVKLLNHKIKGKLELKCYIMEIQFNGVKIVVRFYYDDEDRLMDVEVTSASSTYMNLNSRLYKDHSRVIRAIKRWL